MADLMGLPGQPDPPVVGKVTHHSIELHWDPPTQIQKDDKLRFCLQEEEDSLTSRGFGNVYNGYATRHVITGLDAQSRYKYRLRASNSFGDGHWSQTVTVSTTRQPVSSLTLHKAIGQMDLEEVKKILLMEPHLVDLPDQYGFSPLMTACRHGDVQLMELLLHEGANVEFQNDDGHTNLMEACYKGRLDVIKKLKEHGAAWDVCDNAGMTALHWAVDGGHAKVVQYLIKEGIPVDLEDGSHRSPLMRVATLRGNVDVASCLISCGADVDMKDDSHQTVLMQASLNGLAKLVKLLIESGANASECNRFGKTALDFAVAFERKEVMAILEVSNPAKHRDVTK